MSRRTSALGAVAAAICCLLLWHCRTAGEIPTPETGSAEITENSNENRAEAQLEPPRQLEPLPPPFQAYEQWGEATAHHRACPSSLCSSPAAQSGEGVILGCSDDTVSQLESLPEPPEITGASRDCSHVRQRHRGIGIGSSRAARPMMRRAPSRRRARGRVGGAPTKSVRHPPPAARPARAPVRPAPQPVRTPFEAQTSVDADESMEGASSSGSRPDMARIARSADRLIVIEAGENAGQQQPATAGTLRAQGPDGEAVGEFPLQHTEVSAEITGYIGRTVVEQTYGNPFDEVIEAVYTFPLPGMSAVNDFVMEVRNRRIVGLIRPREEAERIYAEARARGQTASLLTQERPNIFTQSVANIEPGGEVSIRITFFEQLHYEAGHYEWAFPMVVGPRYIPGTPEPGAHAGGGSGGRGQVAAPPGGGGTSPPTNQVPDADRITPPVLQPGERSGHDIGLTVSLDAGLEVQDIVSVAHCVEIAEHGPQRRVIRLFESDSIPNRDFVLRWSVAGAETQFGVLAHRADRGGFLTVMMQPPQSPTNEQVMPREITFLLDVSGSMSGLPLGIAKNLVLQSMERLRPQDRFNIFFFASGNGQLWPSARRGNRANLAAARQFLNRLCGGGGTEMLAGVRRALQAQHDPQYLQMFVFATDGYIGNESQIFHVVEQERGDARFFAFGIGSSINRSLIEGIGRLGGGASHVVQPRDAAHAGRAVRRLFDMIDSPVLVDARIDWNGLPVVDQYPSELPDLFAGQTISAVARFTGPAQGTAYIEARLGREQLRIPLQVNLPESEPANAALAPIWARHRIAELTDDLRNAPDDQRRAELRQQITDVALQFRLVSQFTAFVAVDESRVVGDGTPMRVMQPVELPDGVSYEGVFGEQPLGESFRIPAWGVVVGVGRSGQVGVIAVEPNSPANAAGLQAGAVVTRVDNTVVRDFHHFRSLVLQAGSQLRLTLDPGQEITLPGPTPAAQ